MNLAEKLHEKGYRVVIETEVQVKTDKPVLKGVIETLTEDEMDWKYKATIVANDLVEMQGRLIVWLQNK
ncbi:hypothetical protein COF68_04755 [Bacillus toyonensis]|uniref:hypothetical protein n=1 Tax=Bacillus toyonensis TaxID=155322 RepID=UPI000BFB1876|nr:hypothetical protein [Bacillus toyonensis]PHE64161.1 hypothetical protein COF68_04755 [Bacillus toyonensis]